MLCYLLIHGEVIFVIFVSVIIILHQKVLNFISINPVLNIIICRDYLMKKLGFECSTGSIESDSLSGKAKFV